MSKEICGFDANFLKQVRGLMEETDIEELEIEEGENRYIRVSKKKEPVAAAAPIHYAAPVAHHAPAAPVAASAPAAVSAPAAPAESKYDDETKYHKIKSPVIGTIYEAPSPDSPNFVKLGDSVSKDTTVCIVEAMKVMNEIKAEVKGKIVEISKANASPVATGETLFIVEKA